MTGAHLTGTDRVAACVEQLRADVYVNVQGDEPFVSPVAVEAVAATLQQSCDDVTEPFGWRVSA
ncbi:MULTISPECIES: cytidylyltransferase domain-containing protein [Streptomyces]|uniref:cytidylyltransferase domain-containing protein n=1 Tax=Streptomyces TaxID=1883 RepID=UPI0021F89E29|nr:MULTISPECIES: hypothetical protein [Streptomyces]